MNELSVASYEGANALGRGVRMAAPPTEHAEVAAALRSGLTYQGLLRANLDGSIRRTIHAIQNVVAGRSLRTRRFKHRRKLRRRATGGTQAGLRPGGESEPVHLLLRERAGGAENDDPGRTGARGPVRPPEADTRKRTESPLDLVAAKSALQLA